MATNLDVLELENDICELQYTAHLLAQQVEAEFGPKRTLDANTTAFLAYNLEDRVSALKAKYLSALDQAKPILRRAAI